MGRGVHLPARRALRCPATIGEASLDAHGVVAPPTPARPVARAPASLGTRAVPVVAVSRRRTPGSAVAGRRVPGAHPPPASGGSRRHCQLGGPERPATGTRRRDDEERPASRATAPAARQRAGSGLNPTLHRGHRAPSGAAERAAENRGGVGPDERDPESPTSTSRAGAQRTGRGPRPCRLRGKLAGAIRLPRRGRPRRRHRADSCPWTSGFPAGP